jgi:hypothetical protein
MQRILGLLGESPPVCYTSYYALCDVPRTLKSGQDWVPAEDGVFARCWSLLLEARPQDLEELAAPLSEALLDTSRQMGHALVDGKIDSRGRREGLAIFFAVLTRGEARGRRTCSLEDACSMYVWMTSLAADRRGICWKARCGPGRPHAYYCLGPRTEGWLLPFLQVGAPPLWPPLLPDCMVLHPDDVVRVCVWHNLLTLGVLVFTSRLGGERVRVLDALVRWANILFPETASRMRGRGDLRTRSWILDAYSSR